MKDLPPWQGWLMLIVGWVFLARGHPILGVLAIAFFAALRVTAYERKRGQ